MPRQRFCSVAILKEREVAKGLPQDHTAEMLELNVSWQSGFKALNSLFSLEHSLLLFPVYQREWQPLVLKMEPYSLLF